MTAADSDAGAVRAGSQAVQGRVLVAEVVEKGLRAQPLAGGGREQVVGRRRNGAARVHRAAQPVAQGGEVAGGEPVLQARDIAARGGVELRGEHGAQRVRGEVAQRPPGPVHVLHPGAPPHGGGGGGGGGGGCGRPGAGGAGPAGARRPRRKGAAALLWGRTRAARAGPAWSRCWAGRGISRGRARRHGSSAEGRQSGPERERG